jgi:hypothetical protein
MPNPRQTQPGHAKPISIPGPEDEHYDDAYRTHYHGGSFLYHLNQGFDELCDENCQQGSEDSKHPDKSKGSLRNSKNGCYFPDSEAFPGRTEPVHQRGNDDEVEELGKAVSNGLHDGKLSTSAVTVIFSSGIGYKRE